MICTMQPVVMVPETYWDDAEKRPSLAQQASEDLMAEVTPRVELDGSEVRWQKIAGLRKRIAAGTYRVPAEAIAEKMMDAMRR